MINISRPSGATDGQPDWTRVVLPIAGATQPSALYGRFGVVGPLFPGAKDADPSKASAAPRAAISTLSSKLFEDLPLIHLTALTFLLNDLFNPIWTEGFGDKFPDKLTLNHCNPLVANCATGAFSLDSVYGRTGLIGDHALQLENCIRWPWDIARLWDVAERSLPFSGSDVLRLNRVVMGDGAPLDESYFYTLPEHLRHGFFREGELHLGRAIIPEPRNDGDLILSQFHAGLVRLHNRLLKEIDPKRQTPRDLVFHHTRRELIAQVKFSVFYDLLPTICDRQALRWSMRHKAPLHRQLIERTETDAAVPIEASLFLALLLALLQPSELRLSTSIKLNTQHLEDRQNTTDIGLPASFFVSQVMPKQLARDSFVDWSVYNGETLASAGRRHPDLREIDTLLQNAARLGFPSAQACQRHLSDEFDLSLPMVSDAALAEAFDRATAKATPLLPYLVLEAATLGENCRLGPLGSLLLAEMMVGAMGSTDIPEGGRKLTLAALMGLSQGQ